MVPPLSRDDHPGPTVQPARIRDAEEGVKIRKGVIVLGQKKPAKKKTKTKTKATPVVTGKRKK